jgi:hypothetical protein
MDWNHTMVRHGIYPPDRRYKAQIKACKPHGDRRTWLGNFLSYKLVHCCLRVIERRERTPMMPWGSGEAPLKSLCPIATVLTLVASGWAASAETAEDRQACTGDAFRVCWSAIPDRNNVLQCLVENRNRLNPDCREVITRYTRSHRHKATRSAHSARSRAE